MVAASAAPLADVAPAATPADALAVDLALSAAVSLPEFAVRQGRPEPRCLYGEVPGIQILSLWTEKETKAFAHEVQVQRFLLGQIFPEEQRAPFNVPLLFILKPPETGNGSEFRGPDGTVLGPSNASASAMRFISTVSDLDAMAVLWPHPDGRMHIVTPAYPTDAFLTGMASWMPSWARSELSVLLSQVSVEQDALRFSLRSLRLGRASWPPVGEFFYANENRAATSRGGTSSPPASNVPQHYESAPHAAFVRWALLKDKSRAQAYWTFVRRAGVEPVTEAMFRECFGCGYAEMQVQLRGDVVDGKQMKIATPEPPDFPLIGLHEVTATELARTKAEWKRLVTLWSAGDSFGFTSELRRRLLDELVGTLEAAYRDGERDPQTLAELALAECDARRSQQALPLLEAVARARLARPRIYFELARLRYIAAKAASEGRGGRFDLDQVASVMEPLTIARGLVPAIEGVYILMADTFARAPLPPTQQELAMMDEGVRLFPNRIGLAGRATAMHAHADSSVAEAGTLPTFFHDLLQTDQEAKEVIRQATTARGLARAPTASRTAAGSVQLRAIPPVDAYRVPRTGDIVFNFLPKSLQLNPLLDMTVATHFTPYGRLIRPATPKDPVYFVLQSAGFHQVGDWYGGQRSPPTEQLELAMISALAANGYRSTDLAFRERRPSLAVVFSWGTHHQPALNIKYSTWQTIDQWQRESYVLVNGGLGSPVDWDKRQELWDQVDDDLYFVVASAYDYDQLAQGNKKLVWRTNMTVGARGVAMTETLLPLIASASPYFGREMLEPEITSRRISRVGRIQIGALKTVEDDPKPPKRAPAPPPGEASPTKP